MPESFVMMSYVLPDGRFVGFNHPDAIEDRRKALGKIEGKYRAITKEDWKKLWQDSPPTADRSLAKD